MKQGKNLVYVCWPLMMSSANFPHMILPPRSASIQTLGPCTILVMKHADFIRYLKEIPDLALGFIKFLSEKLRWTTLFSHSIAQYDTAGRLIHLILHYKDLLGREIAVGKNL